MTMVQLFRNLGSRPTAHLAAVVCMAALTALVWLGHTTTAQAQRGKVHYRHRSDMPPGVVGREQLQRGGPLVGYFQPLKFTGPPGSMISLAVDGQFDEPQPSPATVGMLIGAVYRLRVTRIPLNEGLEVFPTVEVIGRLYPPPGHETRFAIPVELTREDLELALDGNFVTRVIYVEDPQFAFPVTEVSGGQRYLDVANDEDPLQIADTLGRPVAILRMGSRLPEVDGPSDQFMYGSAPLVKLAGSAFGGAVNQYHMATKPQPSYARPMMLPLSRQRSGVPIVAIFGESSSR